MRALTVLSFSLLPLLGPVGESGLSVVGTAISSDAPGLEQVNGALHYRGEAFSGYVVEKAGGAVLSHTRYVRGQKHGLAEAFYPDGTLKYERRYELGRREGTHRGFWQNGQAEFVQRYMHDLLEGEQVAFYENGGVASLTHYHEGHEEGLQRSYDKDGRIIVNYTFRNGRRYGIFGRFDCISMVSN